MNTQSFIELSSSAFAHNIKQIKKAAQGSQVAVVLKSNAYGHGLQECALFAKHNPDIAWTCTATISEALAVYEIVPEKPILVLYSFDAPLEKALIRGFHMTVHTLEDAYLLNSAAENLGVKAFVHIKIDTGMSRLGITCEEAISFVQKIATLPHIVMYGIQTHLCDTPNQNQTFSYTQLQKFDDLLMTLESMGIIIPCTHALSSSGLSLKPLRTYSLLRAGAFAYGIKKSKRHTDLVVQAHPSFALEPVLQLSAPIIALKKIKTGDSVGYDRTFVAQRPTTLAVVPVGYADGYPRGLSNKKDVALLNGHFISIAGLISMNLTTFDVTDVKDVALGDSILLLGGKSPLSIDACAEATGIISNALAVSLSAAVPRVIQKELFTHTAPSESTIKTITYVDYSL